MNEINLKDMRGFTLIELLAVIVVLAIVMLIGLTAVIPLMNQARMQAFAIEANGAIESAQTYFMNNTITSGTSSSSLPTNATDVSCVSISTLIDEGLSTLNASTYSGIVLAKKLSESSNVYLWRVFITNDAYQVFGCGNDGSNAVSVTYEMVQAIGDANTTVTGNYDTCPTTTDAINALWAVTYYCG